MFFGKLFLTDLKVWDCTVIRLQLQALSKLAKQSMWAASWQNQQCGSAPSEDSDQPGHPPPSLIRVFAVRMKKAWVLSYQLNAQRRLWSDWADAHSEDSYQTGRMPRLIWVFAGRTATLLVLSWGGSVVADNVRYRITILVGEAGNILTSRQT